MLRMAEVESVSTVLESYHLANPEAKDAQLRIIFSSTIYREEIEASGQQGHLLTGTVRSNFIYQVMPMHWASYSQCF